MDKFRCNTLLVKGKEKRPVKTERFERAFLIYILS